MGINIHKPRYNTAFQSKSKIWSYKDSRLRRFFNIRGRKLVRRGYFKRIFIVFNNMKWTIARRYIRPYMRRRRKGVKRQYKKTFNLKQQLKQFYGNIKEEFFCNFFKKHSGSVNLRNLSFYSALERRTDMFFFRTRLLPTIYAANQFVHHQGININGRIEKSGNALIRPGDILTLDAKYWNTFTDLLYVRIFFRVHGLQIWKKRAHHLLKKKGRWILRKNKLFKRKNKRILKKIYVFTKKIVKVFKKIVSTLTELFENHAKAEKESKFLALFTKDKKQIERLRVLTPLTSEQLERLRVFTPMFSKNLHWIKKRFKAIRQLKKKSRRWKWKNYYKNLFFILSTWFLICKRYYNILYFLKCWELNKKINEIKNFWELKLDLATTKKEIKNLKIEYYNILKVPQAKMVFLKKKFSLFSAKLREAASYIISRRVKKKGHKILEKINKFGGIKKYKRRNSLYYFLMYRKYKQRRKNSIPRLKSVHWYIPAYIYFDISSMQAIFLYNPLPQEICYSFKCSLPKIYSFYKSRGF